MDVFEELGRGDAAYAFALSMHNAVANAIARFGQPELRERYAARLVSGELLGGFSLTEPHAGSDAAAITTRAIEVDDGWRVSGRKAWVSLAGEADVFVLVCRTGTERGTGDVLMLAVDARADGVRVERLYDKAAGAFLPIGEVSYDEVHVPAHALLAPAGQGMRAALGAIDVARVDIAAIAVGLAAESLAVALDYARGRRGVRRHAARPAGDPVRARRRRDRRRRRAPALPRGGRRARRGPRQRPRRARQALLSRRGAARRDRVQRGAGRIRPPARVPARALPGARQDAPGGRRHDRGAAHRHRARSRAALMLRGESAPRIRASSRARRAGRAASPLVSAASAASSPVPGARRRSARARGANGPAATPKRRSTAAASSRGVSEGSSSKP